MEDREILDLMEEGNLVACTFFCECSLDDRVVRPVRWVLTQETRNTIQTPVCDRCKVMEEMNPYAGLAFRPMFPDGNIPHMVRNQVLGRIPREWRERMTMKPDVRPNIYAHPAFRGIEYGPQALMEFAARLCYNSVGSMGRSPTFLEDLWEREHYDVFEHAAFVYRLLPDELAAMSRGGTPDGVLDTFRFARVVYDRGEDVYWVLANARVIRSWGEEFAGWYMAYDRATMDPNIVKRPPPSLSIGDISVSLLADVYHPRSALGHMAFLIEGISRTASHQLVRHRLMSYSQESQRYVDMAEHPVVMPPSIVGRARIPFTNAMSESRRSYVELRGMRIRKEDARFVLPEAMMTRMVMSGPFDGWEHFFWLRALDKAAQWEIRTVALICLALSTHEHPAFVEQRGVALDNMELLAKHMDREDVERLSLYLKGGES